MVAGKTIARLNRGTPTHTRANRIGLILADIATNIAKPSSIAKETSSWMKVMPKIRIKNPIILALGSIRLSQPLGISDDATSLASASTKTANPRKTNDLRRRRLHGFTLTDVFEYHSGRV
jgi:hypothetical protein